MRDIEEDSLIIVCKMGHASRTFSFREKRSAENKEPEPFWTEKLKPGTAVIMGTRANKLVEHGVPADGRQDEAQRLDQSSSVVLRRISTVLPWDEVTAKQQAARRTKAAALKAKQGKKREVRSKVEARGADTPAAAENKKSKNQDDSALVARWFAAPAAGALAK